jgi:hypothetical protein
MKPADINNNSNNRSINIVMFGCKSADSAKREKKLTSSDRIMSKWYNGLRFVINVKPIQQKHQLLAIQKNTSI